MIVTIDGKDTLDMDDAISFEWGHRKMILKVYIADVSSIVSKDSELYKLAYDRMETDYIQNIPMLPRDLAEDKLSLVVGKLRRVITATYTFVKTRHWRQKGECVFSRDEITVDSRLTYEEADLHAISDGMRIAHKVWNRMGFLPYYASPTYVQGEKEVELVPNNEQSRKYLTIIMQMTNISAAKQIMKYGPAITVHREENTNAHLFNSFLDTVGFMREMPYKSIYRNLYHRPMYMPILLTDPRNNRASYGLNKLNCMVGTHYTQFTSPIRRFVDLVAHIQLVSSLDGNCAYTENELVELLEKINNYKRIKQDYTLATRYLGQHLFWGTPINEEWVYISEINRVIKFKTRNDPRMILLWYRDRWAVPSYN